MYIIHSCMIQNCSEDLQNCSDDTGLGQGKDRQRQVKTKTHLYKIYMRLGAYSTRYGIKKSINIIKSIY